MQRSRVIFREYLTRRILSASIFVPLFTIAYISSAQDNKVSAVIALLQQINSVDEAEAFANEARHNGRILKIDSEIETNEGFSYLLDHKPGAIFSMGENDSSISEVVKLIQIDTVRLFRVQYIYFDNGKIALGKIEKLRAEVLRKLAQGESFDALAGQYSMDSNAQKGGDLGWFEEGQMMKVFESAVRDHSVGEVFKIDIPENKWYYIVRKSHEPKVKRIATALLLTLR